MSDFPDDHEATGYGYVVATTTDYGHGHLKLVLRTKALMYRYPKSAVDIIFRAQFGQVELAPGADPSYGHHTYFSDHSDGLEANNLERVVGEWKRIDKRLERVNAEHGYPLTLADHVSRRVVASGVKYLYMPASLNTKQPVPAMDLYLPSRDITRLRDRVVYLTQLLAKERP